jgi:phosphohistidine phosphatase
MKRLAVMRHADAKSASIDYERPLSTYGLSQAAESAKDLKQCCSPDLVLVSGALRTRMTAKVVKDVYSFDDGIFEFDDRIYESSLSELSKRLREVDNNVDELLLIGHNPGVSMLVSSLIGQYCTYTPGTYVLIEFDNAKDWQSLKRGKLLGHFSPALILFSPASYMA